MSLFDSLSSSSDSSATPDVPPCSRKGCKNPAVWQVLWNNPKIHTPERRKIWLACAEHRAYLEEFLQLRGFWKETLPFEPPVINPAVSSFLASDSPDSQKPSDGVR